MSNPKPTPAEKAMIASIRAEIRRIDAGIRTENRMMKTVKQLMTDGYLKIYALEIRRAELTKQRNSLQP